MLYANRLYSPGSLESGAVSAQVLYNRIPTIQLSIAGRCCSTATAVIGICLNCISIAILLSCYFLTRDFTISWRLLARFRRGATCLPPPPWPELVSYIRKLDFQSSSLSPLDRFLLRFVYIVILAARGARCAIQHSASYCVKIKFYASIQRIPE